MKQGIPVPDPYYACSLPAEFTFSEQV